jgi:hypothetical protein
MEGDDKALVKDGCKNYRRIKNPVSTSLTGLIR